MIQSGKILNLKRAKQLLLLSFAMRICKARLDWCFNLIGARRKNSEWLEKEIQCKSSFWENEIVCHRQCQLLVSILTGITILFANMIYRWCWYNLSTLYIHVPVALALLGLKEYDLEDTYYQYVISIVETVLWGVGSCHYRSILEQLGCY